jgi:post-segregation antitoxin (ccd killing protein)
MSRLAEAAIVEAAKVERNRRWRDENGAANILQRLKHRRGTVSGR